MPITEHLLEAQAFLEMSADRLVLDVRSPREFARGHLPGAISFPLFTDDERAKVGTTYRQQGKTKAIDEGLDLVGPKLRQLATRARGYFLSQNERQPLLIYCWRGGMRSRSVDWLLRTAEIPTVRCAGGYKACRRVFTEALSMSRPYAVVGGMTGSAKTEVIHSLRSQNQPVIDLEGIAKHFGSAFGNLDGHEQPSTEQFVNALAWELMKFDWKGERRPLWVENESRQIGRVHVPEMFHKWLRTAPVLELERTEEDRVEHLISMYGEAPKPALIAAFKRIRDKLGGQHAQAAIAHVQDGDLASAARIALVYYDKTYRHGLNQRSNTRSVNGRGLNPDETAKECREILNKWNPWNLPQMSD